MATRRSILGRALVAAMVLLLLALPSPAASQALRPELSPPADAVGLLLPPPAGDLVYQAGCTPRPRVTVQSEKIGEKDFRVTITAGQGNLELLRFGNSSNTRIDLPVPSPQSGGGLVPPFDFKPPAAPSYTFTVRSTGVGAPVTQPITVFDGCGVNFPWNTFVGGGQSATQVQASIADASITEGNSGTTNLAFTVTLASPASVPVTIQYVTANGTATAPADYTATNGTLNFAVGDVSETINVPIVGDLVGEPTETFTVQLNGATGASIRDGTATGTIVDNEGAPSLAINDVALAEGNSGTTPFGFTVSLSGPSALPISVQYATANDTATAGADYTAIPPTTLTFAPGETTKPVVVQVAGETLFEPNERFFVNLTNPTNATISKAQGVGTITNDDGSPSVTLSIAPSSFAENGGTATVTATLSNPSVQDVTVALAFGGSATPPPGPNNDFTAPASPIVVPAGQTTGTLVLTAVADAVFEGPEDVEVSIASVTNGTEAGTQQVSATINEGPGTGPPTVSLSLNPSAGTFAEDGGFIDVVATLTGAVDETVTITLTFSGTATASDYTASATSIQITSPGTTGSIRLTGVNDGQGEGAETVIVAIQTVTGGGVTAVSPTSVQATIVDDDGPTVTTTAGSTPFAEGGGPVVVDGGVLVTSAGVNLVSATVTIANPLNGASEVLAATPSGAILAADIAYSGATLTITRSAPASDYQTVLRSVTYNNTADAPNPTARTINFQVSDASFSSNVAAKTVTIGAVNDKPSLTGIEGTPVAYAENGAPIQLTDTIAVADLDSPTLAGGTVQITANCAPDDVLELATNPTSGVSGTYTAATCLLTLSGAASPTSYQDALRAVRYSNTSNNPSTLPRTVSFQVNDGAAANNLSDILTRTVNVGSANDVPVVTTSAGITAFVEDGGPVTVDGGVTVTDADNTTLASATVTISNLQNAGQETLAATASGAILQTNITYAAPTLTITQAGAPLADYQAVLRSVTYNNTSNSPTTTPSREITFQVNDGTASSVVSPTSTKTVSITAVNSAPVVTTSAGITAFVENGGPVTVDGGPSGVTVTDADSTTLASATVTITNIQDATFETLAATPSGTILAGDIVYVAPTLTITRAGGSLADYQDVLRSVTYNNTSNGPTTTPNRSITFQVNDGTASSVVGPTSTKAVSVAAANDAPVITLSGSTPTFTEGDLPVTVDGGLTIADLDDTNLESATITLTNPFAGDVLDIVLPGGSGISEGASTATTILLTGTASLDAYRDALRAVTFANTSQDPTNASRTVRFVVNDGTDPSNNADKTVTVVSVNDAPVVTAGGTLNYTENQAATAIDTAITVADLDDTNLETATIQITGNCTNPQDVLSYTTALGITAQPYDAVNCLLTLTGTTTVANYQTALRNVLYANSSENPSALARTVTWTVTDGTTSSAAGVTSTINVTPVNDPPNDADESFAAQANVGIVVAAPGLLAGATDPDGGTPAIDAASVGTFPTTQGGSITIAADGSFSYTPQAGDTSVADTFVYTITDGQGAGGTNTSTVTFNVDANAIWFVDLAAGSNGDGTLTSPFNSLAGLDDGGPDADGETIFVYTSDASIGSTALTEAFDLQASQHLIGEGVTNGTPGATINTVRSFTTHPNSRPLPLVNGPQHSITSSTSDALTLASGNTLRGFDVGSSGTGSKIAGTSFGTLTVGEVGLSGAGQALNLTTGTLSGGFTGTSSTSGTNNVKLTSVAGTFNLGSGALSGASGPALLIGDGGTSANAGGTVALTYSGTISAGTGRAVDIQDRAASAGNVTLSGAITGAGGQTAIFMDGNAAGTYTFSGAVTANSTTATAINLTNNNAAAPINFTGGLNIDTTTGTGFVATGGGTVSVQGSGNSIDSTGGQAINLNGVTVAAAGMTFASTDSDGGTNNVNLANVTGTGAINLGGGALSGATGVGFLISGGTGSVDYNGTITHSAAARAIDVNGHTSGTISFDGNVTSNTSSDGINLSGNTSATIAFTGNLTLISGPAGGAAFNATGGTVTATGSASTINSGNTTALNVANTNIGSNGLKFQSIAANSAPSGIVLNNTGSSGGLTVTGDGANARNGSGGTITNTTGDGISLTNTAKVSLSRMNINNSGSQGIFGTGVNGFVLDWASMTSNGDATKEGAIRFGHETDNALNGLVGTGPAGSNPTRIANSLLSASHERNVSIFNSSGTLTQLDVDNTTIQNAANGSGFLIETRSSATATTIVTRSTFQNNFAVGIQGSATAQSTLTLKVLGVSAADPANRNTFTDNNEGVLCSNGADADATCEISNNMFTGQGGNAIFVGNGINLTNAAQLNGKILNNTVTQPLDPANANHAVQSFLSGIGAVSKLQISGNTVDNKGQFDGIHVNTPDNDTSPNFHVTVTNNNVTTAASGVNAINVNARKSSTACFKVEGNTTAAPGIGVQVRESDSATASLERGTSAFSDPSTVLAANNPAAAGTPPTFASSTVTVVNNGTCLTPP